MLRWQWCWWSKNLTLRTTVQQHYKGELLLPPLTPSAPYISEPNFLHPTSWAICPLPSIHLLQNCWNLFSTNSPPPKMLGVILYFLLSLFALCLFVLILYYHFNHVWSQPALLSQSHTAIFHYISMFLASCLSLIFLCVHSSHYQP